MMPSMTRDLAKLPSSGGSLFQWAKHYSIGYFQQIIYLALKLILSNSKYMIFLQKLALPGFPFLSVMIIFMGV